jgi:hypothetical protein
MASRLTTGLGGMDWLRRKKWNTVTSFYVTSENVFVAGSWFIKLLRMGCISILTGDEK